jgi:hypothetical protein
VFGLSARAGITLRLQAADSQYRLSIGKYLQQAVIKTGKAEIIALRLVVSQRCHT